MSWASDNEEATTATIGRVHDRSDDDYSEEETDWEAENKESARKWSRDKQFMVKVHRERQEGEMQEHRGPPMSNMRKPRSRNSVLRC
jgi:hypothetical protein